MVKMLQTDLCESDSDFFLSLFLLLQFILSFLSKLLCFGQAALDGLKERMRERRESSVRGKVRVGEECR